MHVTQILRNLQRATFVRPIDLYKTEIKESQRRNLFTRYGRGPLRWIASVVDEATSEYR